MSLFDRQDVCIVIESLATLYLPMVVDLIGINELKGPYCTLTTTNWFFQALSEIPRGSWGDVARRFTMIRWASPKLRFRSHNSCGPTASCIPEPLRVTQLQAQIRRPPPLLLPSTAAPHASPQAGHAPPPCDRTCFDRRAEKIPSVEDLPPPTIQEPDFLANSGWSQAPRLQQGNDSMNTL
ncbi:acyl-CoA dehydrogenase family member 10 [Dorcoceras hygrometricum]|uniref:Acyl-CoA dehydrogenase family member 10 n=1 Tax=Dorcoceras hygrometricum TaxID=472368 RepID=A0A2Z7C1K1_9LAMI|nr:acyl-CoA dehydrogenase family member 10 [Dorcoceras hygrometricum]